jgi:type I restriction enzyme S subunit
MSGASGRQRVRNECFDAYRLAVPPRELADRFEECVGPLFDTAYRLSLQARQLSSLRDLLLPKLVMGQIDVSSLGLGVLVEESVA